MLHPLKGFVDPTVDSSLEIAAQPAYWYAGYDPQHDRWVKLPRTALAEAIARGLMQQLAADERHHREGKMYGVLLVETATGERKVLKAFSGLLNGEAHVPGWMPPMPGRDRVADAEAITLAQLNEIKQQLLTLQQIPERQQYAAQAAKFSQRLQDLAVGHRDRKQQRQQQRQRVQAQLTGTALTDALAALNRESQQDGIERRHLKQERDAVLQPLQQILAEADRQIQQLKQRRRLLSRQLQQQMHRTYWLTNFAGESVTLDQILAPDMMPTGTGDCCAPKLLHYAATHQLKPLAMAEFWWGRSTHESAHESAREAGKVQGQFYGACAERCQPLMGFLLAGLRCPPEQAPADADSVNARTAASSLEQRSSSPKALKPNRSFESFMHLEQPKSDALELPPVLYEDEWLIAIDKPAGLLSVPGRYRHTQDSVLSRYRCHFPNLNFLAVHRLDQDTSGILLLAKDETTYRDLSQQFQQRRVHKLYQALVVGQPSKFASMRSASADSDDPIENFENFENLANYPHDDSDDPLDPTDDLIADSIAGYDGEICLPLWSCPSCRPKQVVDWQRGKPCLTRYRLLQRQAAYTRVQFVPVTGRTHQLRVHAAHEQGLNAPILGDRLYGRRDRSSDATDIADDIAENNGNRLHLHACELALNHPRSRHRLILQSTVPF
jgi:tRNA pseudouridine32 synthase/23S rRNA pseudouridine746 synthase